MRQNYSFDDVLLLPQYSEVFSRADISLKVDLNRLIIGSSIGGDCSIRRSYSALHTFKKSFAGFLLLGSIANSTDIFLPNLDH